VPITFTLDQKSCAETLLGSKANPRKANPKHPIASKKKRSRSDNQGCRIARNVHNVGNDFIAEVMGVRRTRNARSEDMGSAPGNTLSFYVASGAAKSSESGKTKKVVSETCECVYEKAICAMKQADARAMLKEKRATTLIMAARTFFVRVWRPAAISRHSSRQCRALS